MAGGESRPERKKRITMTVNRKNIDTEIDVRMTLAEFLREELDLTGTKVGCNMGECGSCTVILDGKPVYSCTSLAVEALGKEIQTVEGLSKERKLHPLQASFIEHDGLQCGYCTPGVLMSTKALLDRNPHPTEYDVRRSIDGNLCRCGSYLNIIEATITASEKIPR